MLRNGNQQILVTVQLNASDANGNIVPLSSTELANIQLVTYVDEKPLTEISAPSSVGWAVARRAFGYVYDRQFLNKLRTFSATVGKHLRPSARSLAHVDPLRAKLYYDDPERDGLTSSLQEEADGGRFVAYQTRSFYLSTTATSNLRVAAKIKLDNGTIIISNRLEAPLNDPKGAKGLFNCDANFTPLNFPSLPSEKYGTRKPDNPTVLNDIPVGGTGSPRFFEHHINIRLDTNTLIEIKQWSSESGHSPSLRGVYGRGWKAQCSFTRFTRVDSPILHIADEIKMIKLDGVSLYYPIDKLFNEQTQAKNFIPGQIVIWQSLFDGAITFREGYNTPQLADVVSTQLYLWDIYGNRHNLTLRFADNTNYNWLMLDKR